MEGQTPKQVAIVGLVAVVLGVMPVGVGMLLGFAAFVVTPALTVAIGVMGGALIAHVAPQGRWVGVVAAAFVVAAIYTALLWLPFVLQALDKNAWVNTLPIAALMFIV